MAEQVRPGFRRHSFMGKSIDLPEHLSEAQLDGRACIRCGHEAEIAEYFGPAGTWDAYLGTRVLPLEDILPALDLTPRAIFAILHQV